MNVIGRLMSTMDAIKTTKAIVRKRMEEKLASLSLQEKQKQSKIVREKLFQLDAFKNSKNVSIFLSMNSEIDTEPIVRKIFDSNKRCFVPRYNKKIMEMVELYSMEDWSTLPVTKWNIKQPSFEDGRINALDTGLDLIILPGVAFTREGDRLGHGGGYYDKFLDVICKEQPIPPILIALAFEEQVLDSLPTEKNDYKVDKVLFVD
ncbi:5-formyltetrahydrofolate cyclo-ligase isoform X1 [Diorhabda carinulata]|uniref:5-formyltetrahydrofolate cyclo-ligase isoform X1 n=1 Tax=Diorhabda carinulata TaxID=1163345 RepID=UPI0025A01031|nr:5-formyltetrahydrofolate cyclo-ligase isoform X1 [Diorhabda carinulata]